MEQEEQIKQERQIKGIWIPIEIWKDKSLSWNEKILFLEIDSYTSKDKDCYFSNEYISELLGISIANASKTLSSLIKKGYVIKTKFDGRKRYIKSALSFSTSLPCQEQQPSHARAFNYNNNTDKDNNNKDNKDKEKEDKSSSKKKPKEFIPPTIQEVEAYIKEKGYNFSAKAFVDYYEADDWHYGKGANRKKVSNWKRCCATWDGNRNNNNDLFSQSSNSKEEDMMQKFLSLTESEQAKILQLDAYQYHMLPTSAKEGWMNNRKQFILQWFTENGQ